MQMPEALKKVPKSVLIMSGLSVMAVLALLIVGPMVTGSAEVLEAPPGTASEGPLVGAGGVPRVTSFGDPSGATGPLPRDPFAPLIQSAAPGSGVSAAAPPAPAAPAGAAPAAPGVPAAAPAPAAPAPAPAPPAPPAPPAAPPPEGAAASPESVPPPAPTPPQPVRLVDVIVDLEGVARAVVDVGQARYVVRAGEIFDNNYRVVSISASCATFARFADEFSLCKGETAIK